MNAKQATAIIFVLAALLIAGCPSTPEIPPGQENATDAEQLYLPPFAEEAKNTTREEFAANLLLAQNVYLIEDVRGLETYPLSRKNIMQCGTDYAGSSGIAGKTFTIFVFDDGNLCYTAEGEMPISQCYEAIEQAAEDEDTAIIWIEKGELPEFYSRGLLVRINEAYVQGLCSINVVGPEPEEGEVPGGEQESNETAAEEGPEEGNAGNATEPEPEIPEANETEGESHTFP